MTDIKITEDDIHVILDETVGENDGYKYNVKFLSLEGYDICWKKEQAEQLKKQIIKEHEIVERLRNES